MEYSGESSERKISGGLSAWPESSEHGPPKAGGCSETRVLASEGQSRITLDGEPCADCLGEWQ
jgi:hypothetical protein